MNLKKPLRLLAAGLAALSLAATGHAADPQTTSPAVRQKTDAVKLAPAATGKQAVRVIGKRPVRLNARPGWLGTVSGEQFFLMKFDAAFTRLDKNKDGLVKWALIGADGKLDPNKAGLEPLPASYDACYLIDYVRHPAKKEKDPAHPGQYIETPETIEITGWKTWKEALAGMSAPGYPAQTQTGVCNKTEMRAYCKKGAYETARSCAFGKCNCYPGVNGYTVISKEVCVDKQTVPTAFTKEQWMKVAKEHFKREDWNKDGNLDAEESKEFVCPAE